MSLISLVPQKTPNCGVFVCGVTVYGYRHYTPKTGQFLGRDPIGEKGGNNLYGFVENDGIGNVDVLGKESYEECVRDCTWEFNNEIVDASLEHLVTNAACAVTFYFNKITGGACYGASIAKYILSVDKADRKHQKCIGKCTKTCPIDPKNPYGL